MQKYKKEVFNLEENNKQQIKGLLYEEDNIKRVLALLDTILVSGEQHVKAMGSVFSILRSPIPFTSLDEIETK